MLAESPNRRSSGRSAAVLSGPLGPREAREFVATAASLVTRRLGELVPPDSVEPRGLHRAIRYSLMAPGKRLRPALTLLTASTFGADETRALDPACAIEMVHTASLILDDLPSMDDASLRRGRPANHRVHGEATATLAAIALLNRAYGVIAEAAELPLLTRTSIGALLSRAVGTEGAVAGQCRDLDTRRKEDVETLEMVEGLKTATLFVASAEAGALVAGLSPSDLEPVRRFGWKLGLAFQLRDDWLDAVAHEQEAGKDVRQDTGKDTFVSLLGMEGSSALFHQLLNEMAGALEPLGEPGSRLGQICRELLTAKIR